MEQHSPSYLEAFRGSFTSMLRWPQLDKLWQTLRSQDKAWHIYAVGEIPPERPVTKQQLDIFITEIDKLLRNEHDEDYCGIVYADKPDDPTFIKIYDPNNLGVTCGFSENPPLPGWVLSLIKPVNLKTVMPPPGNRKRWWQKLFKTA